MLLALVGVTGVGKSFFVDQISRKMNFKKVHTIRTRAPREGESTKYFMSQDELNKLSEEGEIAYKFEVFDGEYGYLKSEIFSKDNMIFEMHYTTIYDWKKVRPDIRTIYILPTNLDEAKNKTKNRHLSKEKEIERIQEIDEHYQRIMNDEELRSQFDYIIYNNYDDESVDKMFDLVSRMIIEGKKMKRDNRI